MDLGTGRAVRLRGRGHGTVRSTKLVTYQVLVWQIKARLFVAAQLGPEEQGSENFMSFTSYERSGACLYHKGML